MGSAVLVRGAVGGFVGGVVMAMWSMLVMWVSGDGFWAPLNLIAHTFWRSVPLDGTFSWAGLIVGMVAHFAMAIVLAVLLAALLSGLGNWTMAPRVTVPVAIVFGLLVWLFMQFVVWPGIDSTAAEAFTPWVFAIGHLMYGLVVGLAISRARAKVGRPAEEDQGLR